MENSGRKPVCNEDLDTGVPCDPCLLDSDRENAQFYCTYCDEFLCDTCSRNHKKYMASRQHHFLGRDEMPRKKLSNVQEKLCAKHDEKLIEYFCENHDILCCSVCVTLDHGQCGVKYIDDLAKGSSFCEEYKYLLKQIKDIEEELAEDKKKRQTDSIDVISFFKQCKADIQVFRSEINSKIDAMEYALLHQAEQIQNEDLEAIESMDTIYNKLLVDMMEMSSTLELLEEYKQNKTLFTSVKKARIHVKEYNDKSQSMLHENSVRRYAFSGNKTLLKTFNSPSKLGSLEINNDGCRSTIKIEQKFIGLLKEDGPTNGVLRKKTRRRRKGKEQKSRAENTNCTENHDDRHL